MYTVHFDTCMFWQLCSRRLKKVIGFFHKPSQNVSFPSKPSLQMHLNDPSVLLHIAYSWQGYVVALHSFISAI